MSTPADYTGVVLWLPTAAREYMYDAAKGDGLHPEADGEVRFVYGPVGTFDSVSAGRRPFLRSDGTRAGSLHFTLSTLDRYLTAPLSTSTFNSLHELGTGTILLRVKFDSASAASSQIILDTTNATSVNQGFSIWRNTSEQIVFSLVRGGGNSIVNITTDDTIADTAWHTLKIRVATGAGATSVTIDGGTPKTGTLGTLGTGDATFDLFVGIRQGLSLPMNGQISELVILDQAIDAADETHWDSYNPALSEVENLALQPDATDGVDAYMANGILATANFGGEIDVRAGRQTIGSTFTYRALVRFDVSSLAGATINDAGLTLFVAGGGIAESSTFLCYRVTRNNWTEDGVTWNRYDGASNWTTAGGDYSTDTPAGDSDTIADGTSDLVFESMAALVADAIENRGGQLDLIVIGPETGTVRFFQGHSSDQGTASLRPKLVVGYFPSEGSPLLRQQVEPMAGALGV